LLRRTAEIDEIDVEIVPGKDAPFLGDRGRRRASPVIAARQTGNSSGRGALLLAVQARATPAIATGVASPKAPARPRTVRRERQGRVGLLASIARLLLFMPFSMMILP
jgi:hypothetical protein